MAKRLSSEELLSVFAEMNVNSFGRAMAYLTLVYLVNIPEDVKREAVRLVALGTWALQELRGVFSEECFLGSDVCLHCEQRELKLYEPNVTKNIIIESVVFIKYNI